MNPYIKSDWKPKPMFQLDQSATAAPAMPVAQPQQRGAGGLGGFALDLLPFGRIGEKIVTGRAGDISAGEVGLEAALTALPFGLGRLGKGAKAAKGLKLATSKADDVAKTAPKANKAARGFLRQGTVAGKSTLPTASKQNELIDIARQYPKLRGSGYKKFQNVEDVVGTLNKKRNVLLEGVDATIPSSTIADKAQDLIKTMPKNDAANFRNIYQRTISKAFGGANPENLTLKQLSELKTAVNGQATRAFKAVERGNPLSPTDNAVLELRNVIDDLIEANVSGGVKSAVRNLNRQQRVLIEGIPEFKKLSEEALSVFGTRIPGVSKGATRAFQAGADLAGRTVSPNLATQPLGRAGMGVAQAGLRFPGAVMSASTQPQGLEEALMQTQDMSQAEQYGYPNETPYLPDGISGPLDPVTRQPIQQNPYPRENLLFDIQRDPQNADKYIEQYQMMQEIFAASTGPELTSVQATRAAAAQNALQDIPLIQEAIQSGQLGGAKALPGSGTAIGRRLLGTENLDAALFNIADNILRARSGAAAPEAEVKRFVETFLPGPLDSEEAKIFKLERAVRELQGYVNPTAAAQGSQQADIVEAIMNAQGGL